MTPTELRDYKRGLLITKRGPHAVTNMDERMIDSTLALVLGVPLANLNGYVTAQRMDSANHGSESTTADYSDRSRANIERMRSALIYGKLMKVAANYDDDQVISEHSYQFTGINR
ncbi:hypothetical protein [Buttiauxella agrestis]|uniref:hypothetical protein n=1 Tax=Buttiauxella agrestis TaxID=82977 RepID=UPI0015604B5E|nr:hypothetical protein [Buttiauxella agrestis]BCG08771.1 hypothetical protein BADSM9389_14300 [Buttiauxella agrestis]